MKCISQTTYVADHRGEVRWQDIIPMPINNIERKTPHTLECAPFSQIYNAHELFPPNIKNRYSWKIIQRNRPNFKLAGLLHSCENNNDQLPCVANYDQASIEKTYSCRHKSKTQSQSLLLEPSKQKPKHGSIFSYAFSFSSVFGNFSLPSAYRGDFGYTAGNKHLLRRQH